MISLTESEQQLFDCLQNSLSYTSNLANQQQLFDNNDTSNCKVNKTVIRVAGGWVRDKLLGYDSNDIDIALNNQSGIEFATSINKYLEYIGHETRTIAVIQANPEQSKHLETANIRILGYEIDCVNLRVESYTDTTSRIPTISIGTPLEDALRRDFTINAMFYNLHTNMVEDCTELGLYDLSIGNIRTPITPSITFKDDPLRILRAIRFASRFNFTLDKTLQEAVLMKDIKLSLLTKVSRERVYKECEGCINQVTSRPYMSVYWWYHLHILDAILPLQDILKTYPLDIQSLTSSTFQSIDSCTSSLNHKQKNNFPTIIHGTHYNYSDVSSIENTLVPIWMTTTYYTSYWLNILLSIRQLVEIQLQQKLNTSSLFQVVVGLNDNSFSNKGIIQIDIQSSPKPCLDHSLKGLFWSCLCIGISGFYVQECKKKIVSSLIPIALRESLKMETHMIKNVQIMIEAVNTFLNLYNLIDSTTATTTTTSRSTTIVVTEVADHNSNSITANSVTSLLPVEIVGLLLCECKEMWKDCLLLACAVQLMLAINNTTNSSNNNDSNNNDESYNNNLDFKPSSGIKRNFIEDSLTHNNPSHIIGNSCLYQDADLNQRFYN